MVHWRPAIGSIFKTEALEIYGDLESLEDLIERISDIMTNMPTFIIIMVL